MKNFVVALLTFFSISALAREVLYFTDLEGSRARLERLYHESGGFTFDALGRAHLREGTDLVYGGDIPDRFLGSLWITDELLRLFNETPDRVYLLAGNRDVNKLRLSNELSVEALKQPPYHYASSNAADYAIEAAAPPNRARRLQYIFAKTMGAPKAFELLREEFGFGDDATTEAYLKTIRPGGSFAQVLRAMRMGLRLNRTLFLHGGATPQNVGFVSGQIAQPNVDAWLNKLDRWYQSQLDVAEAEPQTWKGVGARPAEALLEYPMPRPNERSKPESTITGRHVDLENNPLLPEPEAIAFLKASGIQRLIVGHTPIGGLPVIVRTPDQSFEVIFADTSYSMAPMADAWIWLRGHDLERATVHGQVLLPEQKWQNMSATTTLGQRTWIGQLAPDGARVIAKLAPQSYFTTRMKSFNVINQIVCQDLLLANAKF